MEKSNVFTIIFLIVVVLIGGYYLYPKAITPESGEGAAGTVSYAGKECPLLQDVIVDALFEKIEGDWMYFYSKDKIGSVEKAKISKETTFSKAIFSSELEVIREENIDPSEIKNNDGISIVVFCGKEAKDEKIARTVKLIVAPLEVPEIIPENQ